MEKNKILYTPWRVVKGDCNTPFPGIESNKGSIVIFGEAREDAGVRGKDEKERMHNANAIVSAVNGTYGCGINPEAVKDLLNSLKAICDLAEYGYSAHCAAGRTAKELGMYTRILNAANAAIEKSKIL